MKNYKEARKKIASWIRVNHDELVYILYGKKYLISINLLRFQRKMGKVELFMHLKMS